MAQEKVKVVVVLSGGCVTGVISPNFVDYTIFDWDDFADAPAEYWDNVDDDMKAYIEATDKEMFADIQEGLANEANVLR